MPTANPFDSHWVRTSLLDRSRRVFEGGDAERERRALFEELWPWALAQAEAAARRLPGHADADDVRSRVLLAVWESAARIDWDRPLAWPTLLKRRMHGARADAARGDDAMTRRQRQAYAAAAAALAEREQLLGRRLDAGERDAVLGAHFPGRTALFASLAEVVRAREASAGDDADQADERWEPERLALDAARQEAVRRWLASRVPAHVAAAVLDWATRDGAADEVPKRLAARIRPYVADLAGLVGEELDLRTEEELAVAG